MVRIAAIGDLHCHRGSRGRIRPIFEHVNEEADVLVLGGDNTNEGAIEETEILVEELRDVKIPIVAVLGNHDCELNLEDKLTDLLRQGGLHVLDGQGVVLQLADKSIGFAGTRGFCGGFHRYAVAPFGEQALKDFVFSGLREARKVEYALAAVKGSDHQVVIFHYSPIRETLQGEPPELFPFLGNSYLAVPVDALGADVIFHCHAHFGSRFGRTEAGIPVFNVARPIIVSYIVHNLE